MTLVVWIAFGLVIWTLVGIVYVITNIGDKNKPVSRLRNVLEHMLCAPAFVVATTVEFFSRYSNNS